MMPILVLLQHPTLEAVQKTMMCLRVRKHNKIQREIPIFVFAVLINMHLDVVKLISPNKVRHKTFHGLKLFGCEKVSSEFHF